MPLPNPETPSNTGLDEQANFRADMDILGEEPEQSSTAPPSQEEDEKPVAEQEEEEVEQQEPEEEEEEQVEEPEDEPLMRHTRPTVQQVKSKYPDFFKDFPDMRHMLFREGEYARLFPTVDDAKDANARATDFDRFSELLSSGKRDDFKEFLGGVKEAGPEALTSMAANFLPALHAQDANLYYKVTAPIAESMLRNAYKAAVQAGNENLANATLHIAQWAFGDPKYATGEKVSEELVPQTAKVDSKLEEEKKQFYQEKYNDTRGFVSSTSRSRLTTEIRKGLDPNSVFNDFTRNLLTRQIMDEVGAAMEADPQHMAVMNSLWKQAQKAGFAGNWKDRILTTYLSRARQLMPAVRSKIRNAALNGEERKASRVTELATRSADRREVGGSTSSGGQRGNGGRPPAPAEIDFSKTSDMDILNDRVTLKKR